MKETPLEVRIHNNLKAGQIVTDGFLGDDERHYHEIIREDRNLLSKLNRSQEEIAERMSYFTEIAFEHYEGPVVIDKHYQVEYNSYRGKLLCPFSHQGLYRKGEINLLNLTNGIKVCWTPLNIHMIEAHCFFEGKGSRHRLDPDILVKAIF